MNSTLSLTRNKTTINFKSLFSYSSIKNNNKSFLNVKKSLSKGKIQNSKINRNKNLNSKIVYQENQSIDKYKINININYIKNSKTKGNKNSNADEGNASSSTKDSSFINENKNTKINNNNVNINFSFSIKNYCNYKPKKEEMKEQPSKIPCNFPTECFHGENKFHNNIGNKNFLNLENNSFFNSNSDSYKIIERKDHILLNHLANKNVNKKTITSLTIKYRNKNTTFLYFK